MHAARSIVFALSAAGSLVACDAAAPADQAAADRAALEDAAMDGRVIFDGMAALRDLPDGLQPRVEPDEARGSCATRFELDQVRPRHDDELEISGWIELRSAACDAAGPGDAARQRVILPEPDPRIRVELALDVSHGLADMQVDASLDCAPGAAGAMICVVADDSMAVVLDRSGDLEFELARIELPIEEPGQLRHPSALMGCVRHDTPYGEVMACPVED
ncbi:MAG: hypothetical protein H6742_11850 [Alphaproteobacteria bacterium]|nr:hypothetical protein [Alphaproteobacteria bacterium]